MLHNHRREVSFSKIWGNSSPFGIQKGPTLFGCWGYFKPLKYGLIRVMIESSSFWSRIMVGSLNVRDPWLHSFWVLNQRNSEMNRGKEVEWEWWWSDCVTTTCWVIKSNATSPRVDMLWAVGFTSKITQWSRIKTLPPHFSWFQGGYTNQSSDRSVVLTSQVTFHPSHDFGCFKRNCKEIDVELFLAIVFLYPTWYHLIDATKICKNPPDKHLNHLKKKSTKAPEERTSAKW